MINAYRESHPNCFRCLRPSSQTHHIFKGTRARVDHPANIIRVCRECHKIDDDSPVEFKIECLHAKLRLGELDIAALKVISGECLAGWLERHEPQPDWPNKVIMMQQNLLTVCDVMETVQKHQVKCPYCGNTAEFFRSSAIVYGGRDYGPVYACLPCKAWVGTHKNDTKDRDRPLGRLANKELRQAKMAAHAAFDPLWKKRRMNRKDAYVWLACELGIDRDQCHIGEFDVDLCRRVVEVCVGE